MPDRVRNPNPDREPIVLPPIGNGTPDDDVLATDVGVTAQDSLNLIDSVSGVTVMQFVAHGNPDLSLIPTAPLGNTSFATNLVLAGGSISSGNYTAGSLGWAIDYAGNAEFNTVTIRGVLAAQDSGVSLTPNGTFETNVTGWTATNGAAARITSDQHSGAASMELTSTAGGSCLVETTRGTGGIPIIAGQDYRLSVWIRCVTTMRITQVSLNYFDASGADLGASDIMYPVTADTSWAKYLVFSTAPATAATCSLQVFFTASGASQKIRIDDVILSRASSLVAGSFKTSASGGPRIEIGVNNSFYGHIVFYTGDAKDSEFGPGSISVQPGIMYIQSPTAGGTSSFLVLNGGSTPYVDIQGDLSFDIGSTFATKVTSFGIVITATVTSPTFGTSTTRTGGYLKTGKHVEGWGNRFWGTGAGATAGSGTYEIQLPAAVDSAVHAVRDAIGEWTAVDGSGNVYSGALRLQNTTTTVRLSIAAGPGSVNNSTPFAFGPSTELHIHYSYMAAS